MIFPATPVYVMAGNSTEPIFVYWDQLQLGKLRPFAVQLGRLPDAAGLGSEQYAAGRAERTNTGLWNFLKQVLVCSWGENWKPAPSEFEGGSDDRQGRWAIENGKTNGKQEVMAPSAGAIFLGENWWS